MVVDTVEFYGILWCMNKDRYSFDRADIADAAGVGIEVVHKEARRGTFYDLDSLCRWVVCKRLSGLTLDSFSTDAEKGLNSRSIDELVESGHVCTAADVADYERMEE